MDTDIRFRGFVPDFGQKSELLLELEDLKKYIPKDSTVISMLEFDGQAFGCTFDIFLPNGSAFSFAEGSDIHTAIKSASINLEEKFRDYHVNCPEVSSSEVL